MQSSSPVPQKPSSTARIFIYRFASRGIWQSLGGTYQCLETVGVKLPTMLLTMLLNSLQCKGQPPTTKSYLTQNVNSAEMKKPCQQITPLSWHIKVTPLISKNSQCNVMCLTFPVSCYCYTP